MPIELLLPTCLYIGQVFFIYGLLTLVRAPVVWGNRTQAVDGEKRLSELEQRISANLSNQFEWPLLYFVIIVLVSFDDTPVSQTYVVLAWVFLLGRLLHSAVQIGTSNIRLRGLVFTINFLAVAGMWALYAWDTIS